MHHVILFEDDPDADPEIRARHMGDHLAFLERNADAILAAGPLLDGAGTVDGGLWLVDVEDEAAARRLVEADPFWPTGLRKRVTTRAWRRVFAEGARLIRA